MDKSTADASSASSKSPPPPPPSTGAGEDTAAPKKFPKGVVLGKDGKPCRNCTSFADWASLTMKSNPNNPNNASPAPVPVPAPDCPPDVARLGRHTWTLLHSVAATYPERATATQQAEMREFLRLFGALYPCGTCGAEFRAWASSSRGGGGGGPPRVEGRAALGRWMCEAHNDVNRRLGKAQFDCARWEERWRTGWADGRCG